LPGGIEEVWRLVKKNKTKFLISEFEGQPAANPKFGKSCRKFPIIDVQFMWFMSGASGNLGQNSQKFRSQSQHRIIHERISHLDLVQPVSGAV
jgi:hypothetical protein